MRYNKIVPAKFIDRPNRFIAHVTMEGRVETVHVKNTGRCRELLVPGARVYLADAGEQVARKTRYDLVAVEKGGRLINMDSQAPNAAVLEWLRAGNLFPPGTVIRPEFRYGDSRFDFGLVKTCSTGRPPAQAPKGECSAVFPLPTRFASLDSRGGPNTPELALLEVKGVTLVETRSAGLSPAQAPEFECFAVPPLPTRFASLDSRGGPIGDGVALFPDAPTERGAKHLRELAAFPGESYVLFVVQMEGVRYFTPNEQTDPAFAAALRAAGDAGVHIFAYDCRVTPESMEIHEPVEVRL